MSWFGKGRKYLLLFPVMLPFLLSVGACGKRNDTSAFLVKQLFFQSINDTVRLDSAHPYSPPFFQEYQAFQTNPQGIIRVSCKFFMKDTNGLKNANLVITSVHDNFLYKYRYLNLAKTNGVQPGKWSRIIFDYDPPKGVPAGDRIKTMIAYEGRLPLLIGDYKVELFTGK